MHSLSRWSLLAIWFVAATVARTPAADPPIKIITLGDSITHGSRPGVQVHETFASLLQAGFKKDGIDVQVVNVGVGGERTDQALLRLAKTVIAQKPRIVTVMYGTNDSYVDRGKKDSRITADEYRTNLRKIVDELVKAGIQPVLMTSPRWGAKAAKNGAGEDPNVRLEQYVKVCREIAQETKTPLVDHFEYWSKQQAAGKDIGTWTTDQCHPNPAGHQEMVQLIAPVVRQLLKPDAK